MSAHTSSHPSPFRVRPVLLLWMSPSIFPQKPRNRVCEQQLGWVLGAGFLELSAWSWVLGPSLLLGLWLTLLRSSTLCMERGLVS